MLTIEQAHLKDYLEWIKNLITICSAAVATLMYKFDSSVTISWPIKTSAVLFLIAMVSLLVSYPGIVEHGSSKTNVVRKLSAFPLIIGWISFLSAFGFLVINFFL